VLKIRYRQNFKKTIYGYLEVEAGSLEEAAEKINNGDILGDFDNKSDYEFEEEIEPA